MNRELYDQATYPGVYVASGSMLLRRLAEASREQALQALTAALVRPEALEMADALAEPLAAAEAAAAEPLAAVEEVRRALAAERNTIHERLAAFFSSPKRREAGDAERAPADTSPRVKELQQALEEAEAVLMPFRQRADYHREQIAALRAVPDADPVVLAVLAEALVGGHRDVD